MPKTFLKIVLVLLLACCSQAGFGFVKYDPKYDWHTIETAHFLIHYHNGLENIANELALYGETMQQEVSGYFNWTPKEKTHLIISDQNDVPNGYAMVRPVNRIEIFAIPPSNINSLEDFANWKELVFKHEYVHIVQMDMASDFPLHMRDLLGRWGYLFPGQFMPSWIKEGIATHLETDFMLGTGRGQSNYFRGAMRNELIHGLKPLSMVNQIPIDWPNGMTSYLYGVYFFNFLKDRYGEVVVKEFFELYTSIPVPFFLNYTAKRTVGHNFDTLWLQFEEYLHQQFDQQIEQISAQPDNSLTLSNSGYQSGFSRPAKDNKILFISNDLESRAAINQYDPVTIQITSLYTLPVQAISGFSSFDYHPDKGLIIPLSDMKANSRMPTDLYLLSPGRNELTRLSDDGRYIRASWASDGNSIAAVQLDNGRHKLVQLDMTGKLMTVLYEAESDVVIGPIDWSPTDNKILASVFRPGNSWNLEIFDIESKSWQVLTNNSFIESDPQFNAIGDKFLFSADYTGVFNVYEYDLLSATTRQITNSKTIAYQPVYSILGDKIYFAQLGAQGFELSTVPDQTIKQVYVDNQSRVTAKPDKSSVQHDSAMSQNYNGLKYLAPVWWYPTLLISDQKTSVGFITDGNDPLYRHNYYLQMDYDFKNNNPDWLTYYRYTRFYPDLLLANQRQSLYREREPIQHKNQTMLQIELPWIKNNYRMSTQVSYQFTQTEREFDKQTDGLTSSNESNNLVAAMTLDTRSIRNRAFLPYDGIVVSSSVENEDLVEQVERHSRVSVKGKYVSPLWSYNILDIEATVVYAGSLATPLSLGGHFKESDNTTGFVQHDYNLKGYKTDSFAGSSLQRLQISWNLLAAKPQTNLMIPPIGFSRIFFKTYAVAARIGNFNNIDTATWLRSMGTEMQINSDFGYKQWPFSMIAGIAKGLDKKGELVPYIEVILQF